MSLPLNSNFIVDLSSSFGYLFISTVIATALWGMASVQMVMYFLTYRTDTWHVYSFVVLLWRVYLVLPCLQADLDLVHHRILNTVHEILCIQGLWGVLIPKFGEISRITKTVSTLLIQIAVTGAVSTLAQCFFIWRIWRFSNSKRRWMVPAVLVPASVLTMIGFIVYTALTVGQPLEYLRSPDITLLGLVLGVAFTAIDVAISIIMCIFLWKGQTGFRVSNKIVVRLMNATMSTGASTAFFGLVTIVAIGIWPDQLVYSLGELPLCAVYCNAVLANLNARRYLGRKEKTTPEFMSHSQSIPLRLRTFSSGTKSQGQTHNEGDSFGDRTAVSIQQI